MTKSNEYGLKPQIDLASWKSYKALSLSSIKGTVFGVTDKPVIVVDNVGEILAE